MTLTNVAPLAMADDMNSKAPIYVCTYMQRAEDNLGCQRSLLSEVGPSCCFAAWSSRLAGLVSGESPISTSHLPEVLDYRCMLLYPSLMWVPRIRTHVFILVLEALLPAEPFSQL